MTICLSTLKRMQLQCRPKHFAACLNARRLLEDEDVLVEASEDAAAVAEPRRVRRHDARLRFCFHNIMVSRAKVLQ
jgi:hypothetical protein